MRATNERLLKTITVRGMEPASRRALLRGGGKAAAGGAVALALAGAGGIGLSRVAAQDDATPLAGDDAPFENEVEVLNYALTLEHIEATFYREGLEQFDEQAFVDNGFQASVREYIVAIGDHEAEHVGVLTQVVSDLGGEPVTEAEYDFGYADFAGFLATAAALENTGVDAYTGAAQYLIDEDELLTAALTIHGVEARHAAYLNLLTLAIPFPDAFDAPLTPAEVLAIATPFIVGEGDGDDNGDSEDVADDEDTDEALEDEAEDILDALDEEGTPEA